MKTKLEVDDGFADWMADNYPDTPYFNDWLNEMIEEDGEELQNYLKEYYEY